MSNEITVDVVRVFTDESGAHGNELGIITSSDASRAHEQRIATELGFSETVFIDEGAGRLCSESPSAARTASIRIFTPTSELPFAGHPSVGTAWWLANGGTPIDVLIEKAGDVAVRYDGDLTWIAGRASWAPSFTWMPLAGPADVDALDPAQFADGHYYAYAWIDEAAGELRARMFAPLMGIAEDEATGSAAVSITSLLGRDLEIVQGRGSRLSTRRASDGVVEVGGRTVADRRITL